MAKPIYVTTMYRWGNREFHSYVLYAGVSQTLAITRGEAERLNRGGKYEPEVMEFILGRGLVVYSKVEDEHE